MREQRYLYIQRSRDNSNALLYELQHCNSRRKDETVELFYKTIKTRFQFQNQVLLELQTKRDIVIK